MIQIDYPPIISTPKIDSSLKLVYLNRLWFVKKWTGNRTQIRARFRYNDHNYDLVVTDSEWEEQFRDPNSEFYQFRVSFDGGYYLTIGLGEEFEGFTTNLW